MTTIRELGFCSLNSRADFQTIKRSWTFSVPTKQKMSNGETLPPAKGPLSCLREENHRGYGTPGFR